MAALSLFLCSPVDTYSPQKIHANLLCHNPHYECRTTHLALKVPGWDLNLTDPHPSNLQKKFTLRVYVLVCMHEYMCAAARGGRKAMKEENREQLSGAALCHHWVIFCTVFFSFSEKSETALCVQLHPMCLFFSRPLLFHWRSFSFDTLNPPRLSKVPLHPPTPPSKPLWCPHTSKKAVQGGGVQRRRRSGGHVGGGA